jgi:segregation and condensation protein B
LTPDRLKSILPDAGIPAIRQATDALNEEYERTGRAFRIVALAGGFQIAALPQYADWIRQLHPDRAPGKLSPSALETLAIIAFKQPVIRPEIEAIRGVNSDWVLRTLMERSLIKIVGRSSAPGRPLLYGTTKEFLRYFGLNSVSDLPRPEELKVLLSGKENVAEREAQSLSGPVGERVASESG